MPLWFFRCLSVTSLNYSLSLMRIESEVKSSSVYMMKGSEFVWMLTSRIFESEAAWSPYKMFSLIDSLNRSGSCMTMVRFLRRYGMSIPFRSWPSMKMPPRCVL